MGSAQEDTAMPPSLRLLLGKKNEEKTLKRPIKKGTREGERIQMGSDSSSFFVEG